MKYSENIEELLLLQPDFVGFIFYEKSPRFITTQWAVFSSVFPEDTRKVGVFVDEEVEVILHKVTEMGLEVVQLHGQESPQMCLELQDAGLTVMKAFRVEADFDFEELRAYQDCCNYFLFDASGAHPGGNGVRFNWELLREYPLDTPYFLSGGIGLEHLEEIKALRLPHLYGVDLNSKFEVQPGLKDIDRLKGFMEGLRA